MSLYDWSFAHQPIPSLSRCPIVKGCDPYQYQQAAIQQVPVRRHTFCGHHPGAGKTPIALLASNVYTHTEPVLVVCPPSIVYQWAKQALKWTGMPWYVATNTNDIRDFLRQPSKMLPCRFIVPDSLLHEVPDVADRFNMIIVDEAHRFKTRDSRRTRALYGSGVVRGLRQRTDKMLALSGTPIPNNPTELYPWLHATFPELAPTFAQFANRYCPPESIWVAGREITQYKTAINKDELARKLRETCMIRPNRADILGQLPPMRTERHKLKMGSRSGMTVDEVVRLMRPVMIQDERGDLVQKKKELATARMHLGIAKAEEILPYLEVVIDGGDAPVIWFWHREAAEIVANKLNLPLIHGGCSPEQRRDAIAKFTTGGAKGLVCTIQAAGTGIDGFQHRTDLAIFVERSYVPLDMEQAIGRLLRIGQRNTTRIVIVESEHPIDYAIEMTLNRKESDIAEIVG